ncbi:bifunctional 3-phosphoshikimate 1-carboxyvinyltransferase/cytidylate kinase [Candidatus Symbiobacter mobilis]|uniref:Multifunctional fusion protein n=1 Tax=Candidatus Symbiobacter mobilis CR TaxID=946483 RepID=U5N6K9_9BURK|nr:bifunctional 3-phosphoshikimate 1-carboxyvinyltransferase/cytidylate kinase [Candidatus Symbiobacter mobilis]AGX87017.1 3-phosphoshikimate 1-carboxyvinyltransferase [Candidatus Symbiobacter mobilis CR]
MSLTALPAHPPVAFLDLPPVARAGGRIVLPGSKSISNRALLLAAFCAGDTVLTNVLDSDDTQVMLSALRALGCTIKQEETRCIVHGMGNAPVQRKADLYLGNAGTALRPLTAVLALTGGEYTLRGVPRMHERPIADLVDALRGLGCVIKHLGTPGYPPLRIQSPTLRLDAPVRVRGDVSSQFLTALLLALPLVATQDVTIDVEGELISRPYVALTLHLLARFGVVVRQAGWQRFTIPAGSVLRSPGAYAIEPDASSASYFIALGAIAADANDPIRIEHLGTDSIQGDLRFVDAVRAMGAHVSASQDALAIHRGLLHGIDIDANDFPDAAMTLAALALYAQGPTTLRNIASWRVKETDRITAMACELRKLGATVEEGPDFLRIAPPTCWKTASIHTYDDHRMAMCCALAACNPAALPVRIEQPGCVAKTFPTFFDTWFAVAHSASKHIPVLCIDGPTASGKGTLAAALARRLGYHVLDSGALYRIAALAAERQGLRIGPEGETAIATLLPQCKIVFDQDKVWLDGADVTEAIRSERCAMLASQVSALPAVRRALLDVQRAFRTSPGLVADGRDMGTVLFPDAPLKIFLNASAEERARRRHAQLVARGVSTTLDDLCADLMERDRRDRSRSVAPLVPAQDAVLLDNSALSVEESVELVWDWWQQRRPFGLTG